MIEQKCFGINCDTICVGSCYCPIHMYQMGHIPSIRLRLRSYIESYEIQRDVMDANTRYAAMYELMRFMTHNIRSIVSEGRLFATYAEKLDEFITYSVENNNVLYTQLFRELKHTFMRYHKLKRCNSD
jgi:hypothetical protein